MSALKNISGDQLTTAEKQLALAKDQLTRLDDTLVMAQKQLDAANGINTSVLSVTEAIRNLSAALATQTAAKTVANLITPTPAAITKSAALDYATKAGTDFIGGETQYYKNLQTWIDQKHTAAETMTAMQTYGVSVSDLVEAERRRTLVAYEVGTNYVPRTGPAMLHEGEAIVPKAYNPAAGGGSQSSARLESLVEGLTKEVQRLQSIVNDGNKSNERIASTLDNVTEGGANMRTVVTV
jgi:hypothetical protein